MNPNLPDVERIRIEDFPDADENMKKLITWITRFSEPVFSLINAITGTNRTLVLQTQEFSKVTTAQLPLRFTADVKIKGLWLAQAVEDAGNYTVIGSAVYLDWYQNGPSVSITGITGIDPTKSYKIKVVYI